MTSGQVLLPSCNWFLPSVASCFNDGTLAYGSRNGIILIRSVAIEEGVGPVVQFNSISHAHKEKVVTLAFCNREIPASSGLPCMLLASASEDGVLRIWNCITLQAPYKLHEHREKVTCLDWAHKGNLKLFSGDERGKIVVWDIVGNSSRSINVLNGSRLAPQALACSPSNQDIVAVGAKDGLVCIIDTQGAGQILSKLRGHDKTVMSLSWCPCQEGSVDGDLLASGGLDHKIYIWQTKLNRCIKTISLPVKQLTKGFRARSDNSKGNIVAWLPILWLKPKLLLSASISSELLAWNPMEDKPTPKLVHGEHMRGLACITAVPCNSDDTNWRTPEKPYFVWSLAQDRQLVRSEIAPYSFDDETKEAELVETKVAEAIETKVAEVEEAKVAELVETKLAEEVKTKLAEEVKTKLAEEIETKVAEVVETSDVSTGAQETKSDEEKVEAISEDAKESPAETESEKEDTISVSSMNTASSDKNGLTTEEPKTKPVKVVEKKKMVSKALNVKTTALPTLSGFVYFLAACPFVPGRVAIGVGDESIRIWNMCDTTCINLTNIWQRIKGKVMALAWHPEIEGILAFATADGRVGVYNVSNLNKEPLVFRQFHRSSVYRVAWGPPVYKKGEEVPNKDFCLYASDETMSVYYDLKNLDRGPVLLKEIIKSTNPRLHTETKHKEIAWKTDFSMVAIGLDDGCVQLFSAPHLQIVHTLMAHKKCIYFLLWHPLSTATDTDLDPPQQHWLASSSIDQTMCVFDVAPLLPNEAGEWKHVPLPIEPFAELKHGGKVVGLCWNPHISGQIASCSYDKSVKVWDVAKQEVLACYRGHTGCALSCCWSYLDPDVMLSGSADFSVQCWKISESPPTAEPLPATNASKALESTQGTVSPEKPVIKEAGPRVMKVTTSKDPKKKFQKLTKSQLFPASGSASYNKELALICCEEILRSKGILSSPEVKEDETKTNDTGLQASETAETEIVDQQQQNGEQLVSEPVKENAKSEAIKMAPNMGYFTSQENFFAMLDADSNGHKVNGNYKGCQSLDLWRGNLTESLKSAAQTNTLNEWLVSLAPTVSHKMWQEMCASYADQLINEEEYIKATSYLIACHKVLDAVNLLKSQKLFREALVLSRCRLGPDDPVTKEIMLQWAHSSANLGNFELAAQCYISYGDYDNAASMLNKRQDARMWKIGAILAKETGNTALQTSLASEFFYYSLVNEKWDEASDIIQQNTDLKPLEVLIPVHRRLCELSKEDSPTSEQLATLWRETGPDPQSLITEISEICKPLEDLHAKLLPLMPAKAHVPETRKELLVQVSRHLVLAISARQAGDENWERPIIEAMNICYRRGLTCVTERPLHYLLWWLRAPIPLETLSYSEMIFVCVVMLERLDWMNPDASKILLRFKPYILDTESATFSRLGVMIRSKEKEVAAATANKWDVTKPQEDLAFFKKELEELEKERVAFPNALIMFCKVQTVIDKMRQKNILSDDEFELWSNDLDDYRKKIEK